MIITIHVWLKKNMQVMCDGGERGREAQWVFFCFFFEKFNLLFLNKYMYIFSLYN